MLKSNTKEIDRKNKNFFWHNNSSEGHSRIPLVSWDKICRPKSGGGLGLRKMEDINAASIAKLGWKILTDKKNLWVKLMREKYLKHTNFFEAKVGTNASIVWRASLRYGFLIRKGIRWIIGNGNNV